MSILTRLSSQFDTNWTTILVGWEGLGRFSPWPASPADSPPLISTSELTAYAEKRLASCSDNAEIDLVVRLLSLDFDAENWETVRACLKDLASVCPADPSYELRKWRVVLLEELLEKIPDDPLYGLIALTEFWQNFGFPPDAPHEVQGTIPKTTTVKR